MMVKVHRIKTAGRLPHTDLSFTWCGKSGTRERDVHNEYTTLDGRDARFEVTEGDDKPTCKRCLKLVEKKK